MESINCSLNYYKNLNFSDWPINKTTSCLLKYTEDVGNKIWPDHGTIGFLILIVLLVLMIYLIKIRRKHA